MINHQSDLARDFQALLDRLQEAEDKEGDLSTRLDSCIRLCTDSLRQFRQSVTDHGFPDSATDIYFFKHIKPSVLSRHTYYRRVYHLHLAALTGCWRQEKERLMTELVAITQEVGRNNALLQYYRSGSSTFDEQYFLRSNVDWKVQPLSSRFDDLFTTCCDEQLADLLTLERLMPYIDQWLQADGDPASRPTRENTHEVIRCTASNSEIIELGYALYLVGFFENGKASIKSVMEHLQKIFNVDLSNYYHVFAQLAERKQPARFLNLLLKLYNRYLNSKGD